MYIYIYRVPLRLRRGAEVRVVVIIEVEFPDLAVHGAHDGDDLASLVIEQPSNSRTPIIDDLEVLLRPQFAAYLFVHHYNRHLVAVVLRSPHHKP